MCAAFGLTLLADVQAWASDALLWSVLAVFVGLAMLAAEGLSRNHGEVRHNGDSATAGRAS